MRTLILAITALALFTLGCGTRNNQIKPAKLPTDSTAVMQSVFYCTYSGYGKLAGSQSTDLVVRFPGNIHLRIKKTPVYKKGEIIYVLSGRDVDQHRIELTAAAKSARAEFQLAREQLERRKKLKREEFVSIESWQKLERNFEVTKQNLKKAESDLKYFKEMIRFRAPFNGILSGLAVSQGDYVTAGTTIGQILGIVRRKLVGTYYGNRLELAGSGRLHISLNDSVQTTGTVLLLSPSIQPNTGGHLLWIQLDSLGMEIIPGSFAKYELKYAPYRARAVPEAALVREGNKYFVVTVHKGKFKNQLVTVGRRNGGFRELISGPPVGTKIVTKSAFEYFYKNLEQTMGVQD